MMTSSCIWLAKGRVIRRSAEVDLGYMQHMKMWFPLKLYWAQGHSSLICCFSGATYSGSSYEVVVSKFLEIEKLMHRRESLWVWALRMWMRNGMECRKEMYSGPYTWVCTLIMSLLFFFCHPQSETATCTDSIQHFHQKCKPVHQLVLSMRDNEHYHRQLYLEIFGMCNLVAIFSWLETNCTKCTQNLQSGECIGTATCTRSVSGRKLTANWTSEC